MDLNLHQLCLVVNTLLKNDNTSNETPKKVNLSSTTTRPIAAFCILITISLFIEESDDRAGYEGFVQSCHLTHLCIYASMNLISISSDNKLSLNLNPYWISTTRPFTRILIKI